MPIIVLLSFFLPLWAVRYGFHILMIAVEAFGMFLFFRETVSDLKDKSLKNLLSGLIALIYVFNVYIL